LLAGFNDRVRTADKNNREDRKHESTELRKMMTSPISQDRNNFNDSVAASDAPLVVPELDRVSSNQGTQRLRKMETKMAFDNANQASPP